MMRRAVCVIALVALMGCKRRRDEVDSVPTLEYPAWASSLAQSGEAAVLHAALHGTEGAFDRHATEEMALWRGEQGSVMRIRMERPLQRFSIEVVYDAAGRPLRLWQRIEIPGARPPKAELRLIELRTSPVAMTYRDFDGHVTFERARNPKTPTVVVTAALTSLTPWLRAASLGVGSQTRATVFDTERGGVVQEAVLRREEDMDRPELGGRVRVYRLYGRDVYFANDDNVVIGSLAGFVPAVPSQSEWNWGSLLPL